MSTLYGRIVKTDTHNNIPKALHTVTAMNDAKEENKPSCTRARLLFSWQAGGILLVSWSA